MKTDTAIFSVTKTSNTNWRVWFEDTHDGMLYLSEIGNVTKMEGEIYRPVSAWVNGHYDGQVYLTDATHASDKLDAPIGHVEGLKRMEIPVVGNLAVTKVLFDLLADAVKYLIEVDSDCVQMTAKRRLGATLVGIIQ